MDESIRQLIFQAIDGTISAADFEQLQDAIASNDGVRTEYLRAVRLCESLGDIDLESVSSSETRVNTERKQDQGDLITVNANHATTTNWSIRPARFLSVAAAVMVLVGAAAFWLGQQNVEDQSGIIVESPEAAEESLIAGHAALRRSVDLEWPAGATSYREGDVLPDGRLQFDAGVAEIDFFCGATLIVEGPAILDIESDWLVRVLEGRLRANVPPAARGFTIKAADSEIIDLGTEFALEVGPEMARVEVLDGEVELRGGEHDGNHLVTGQSQLLKGTESATEAFRGLSTVNDLQRLREAAEAQRFKEWNAHAQQLANDERLVAYYPIAATLSDRVVGNASQSGNKFDAQLVGPVNRETGRFGSASTGLEFDRPGARVRTRIDGEFSAFTFASWVRIDSLEHVYNALFMSDGYENGDLHWQIRNDGRLMFSVMVDESQKTRLYSEIEQGFVETAGLAKVYFTEPIWDVSKSGQWFHLAAVYDPTSRRVEQYVNGSRLSSEQIPDRFFVDTLRIGPAEVGNWGQPFRKTPWFAVRNLNGTIDELAIFDAALTSSEINAIYEQGKPLGH